MSSGYWPARACAYIRKWRPKAPRGPTDKRQLFTILRYASEIKDIVNLTSNPVPDFVIEKGKHYER